MCYDRRRAEACVDESARHSLVNARGVGRLWERRRGESVLFIGTQFSILYTFVYSPA